MKIYYLLCLAAVASLSVFSSHAQNMSPEEMEKRLQESIDKQVEKLSTMLELEYWQEFYVDSILNHDYRAMNEELEKMQKAKVENTDLYLNVQDKWSQQIDDSFKRYFTEEQWKKYWKAGGERAWKARQKRKK